MLSIANPVAFSKTLRLRKVVGVISKELGSLDSWQFMLAAMLSQIGCLTLPSGLIEKYNAGAPLSKSEEDMFASHPLIGYKLLKEIPRIGVVPEMVRDQQKLYSDFQNGSSQSEPKAKMGAQILKVALEYNCLSSRGMPHTAIVSNLAEQPYRFNPEVVKALGAESILATEWNVQKIKTEDVSVGMIAQEDIITKDGNILIPRSQEISLPVFERLQLAAKEIGVAEPFRVLVPPSTVQNQRSSF